MRRAALILTSVLMLFTTAQGEAAAITNGTADNKHPYVGLAVFFIGDKPSHLCSASLLRPDLVLTAGHCTVRTSSAKVFFDEIISDPDLTPPAGPNTFTYPGFCEGKCGPGRRYFPGDVGVIVLDPPLQGVSAFASLPPAGIVDTLPNKAPIDFVGYGVNRQIPQPGGLNWTGAGTRRFAPTELVSGRFENSDVQLRMAMNPGGGSGGFCFGDSGGPDLRGGTNVVLAVNSWVNNSNCAGVGTGARIDNRDILAWINGPHPEPS